MTELTTEELEALGDEIEKNPIRPRENQFEKFFRAKFESNPSFESMYDAWKAGYVQGMMKAAEIESAHHEWKKVRNHTLARDKK